MHSAQAFVIGFMLGAIQMGCLDRAGAHDIYTDLRDKQGMLCCGGQDCQATSYRETNNHYEFLTRESKWVAIPEERIQFLPIPGDKPSNNSHLAHLCYREATDFDRQGPNAGSVFDYIFLYCAFIPPGSI